MHLILVTSIFRIIKVRVFTVTAGNRAKIHDQAHFAYPTYAKATASRRDNLRHSADELRAHLTKAKKALIELGEVT